MKKKNKWYQKVSNWLIILASIILVPLLLINIWIIIQANLNKELVPSVFGYKPFMVLSGSMETEIYQGDLIITKQINPETLDEGDIIAFRDSDGTVTTHRIIDIVEKNEETFFITKGDNNDSQDQNLVAFDEVEGLYIMRIPSLGTLMNKLAEPTNFLIIALVVTVIFVVSFSISFKKQRAEEMKEFLEFKKLKEELKEKEISSEEKSVEEKETKSKSDNNKKAEKKSQTNKKSSKKD